MAKNLDDIVNGSKQLRRYVIDKEGMSAEFSVYELDAGEYAKSYLDLDEDRSYRYHAYSDMDAVKPNTLLCVLKNTLPKYITKLSEGDDSKEFRHITVRNPGGSKNSMYNVISSVLGAIEEEQKKLGMLRLTLSTKIDTKSVNDLDKAREYIIPNARKNYEGVDSCWHVYANGENSFHVLEHPVSFDSGMGLIFVPPTSIGSQRKRRDNGVPGYF